MIIPLATRKTYNYFRPLLQLRHASSGPRIAKASVVAESDAATTTVIEKHQTFLVDEPEALGGKGSGASPLGHFLGALIGCTQITLHTICQEQRIKIGKVRWHAVGRFDLRGLRGEAGTAKFQEIDLIGEVDTHHPERVLGEITDQIKRRCIISATISESQNTKVTTKLKATPTVFKSSMGQWMDQL